MVIIEIGITILFIIFGKCVAGGAFEQEPADVDFIFGESITLRCQVGHEFEGANVFWWTFQDSQAVSEGLRIVPSYLSEEQVRRFSIVGNFRSGEFNLHIENATIADVDSYYCRFWYDQWYVSRLASLRQVSPQLPSPECHMQQHSEEHLLKPGDTVRLLCRTHVAIANVKWLYQRDELSANTELSNSSTAVIEHTLSRRDCNESFTCRQELGNQSSECHIVPLIITSPIYVEISASKHTAYVGDQIRFRCTTSASSACNSTYHWFVNGYRVNRRRSWKARFRLTIGNNAVNNRTNVSCVVTDASSGITGQNSTSFSIIQRHIMTPNLDDVGTDSEDDSIIDSEKQVQTLVDNLAKSYNGHHALTRTSTVVITGAGVFTGFGLITFLLLIIRRIS